MTDHKKQHEKEGGKDAPHKSIPHPQPDQKPKPHDPNTGVDTPEEEDDSNPNNNPPPPPGGN